MRVRKQQPNKPADQIIQSLEELKSTYDRETLLGALRSFQTNDLGWKLMKAMLVKEYQNQVVYSMEHSKKSNQQIEAAYRTGCAETLLDTATILIDRYVHELEKGTQVIEDARPEE